jgi:hypothetical protein
MPRLDHARRRRGDVCLAEAVHVIACAVDLGEPATLIEVRG